VVANSKGNNFSPEVSYLRCRGSEEDEISGRPDLICAGSFSQGTITILKNNSTRGNIKFDRSIDYKGSYSITAIAVADMDLDGKPDVVSSSETGPVNKLGSVSVRANMWTISAGVPEWPLEGYCYNWRYCINTC